MRTAVVFPFVVAAIDLSPVPASPALTVTFADPERFTDAADRSSEARQTMIEIERHLERLANRCLSPQETLRIEVLDIDLAGSTRIRPRIDPDLRILDGRTDWPRIELRYTLEVNGSVTSSQEVISDMSYQWRLKPRYASESLPYEKRMLEEWFKERFGPRR